MNKAFICQIGEVNAEGIAAEHGLPLHATNIDGSGQCNWWITEVNHRSLSLFYKDGEVGQLVLSSGSIATGLQFLFHLWYGLQCFDAVGWAAGRASSL